VGLGRDDWRTPKGKFTVKGKTVNPTWVIPDSIRAEHIRERNDYRTVIEGGASDNPLGKYRLELSMPGYRIHGTDIPWGVGMQISHGCVRLYPEDIEALYPLIPIGTPGEFIYQPVKIGARQGRIYAEVSPDIYTLTPGMFTEARRIIAGLGWQNYVDEKKLQKAVEEQNGVPLDVTLDGQLPDPPSARRWPPGRAPSEGGAPPIAVTSRQPAAGSCATARRLSGRRRCDAREAPVGSLRRTRRQSLRCERPTPTDR
jgi:L,D-transpeptidase ErfK/SrfK